MLPIWHCCSLWVPPLRVGANTSTVRTVSALRACRRCAVVSTRIHTLFAVLPEHAQLRLPAGMSSGVKPKSDEPLRHHRVNASPVRPTNRRAKSRSKSRPHLLRNNSGASVNSPPAVCSIGASAPPTTCKRALQLQHSERLAGIPAIISMMAAVSQDAGFQLAHNYVHGGSLVPVTMSKAIPMETYFERTGITDCEPRGRPTVRLRFSRYPWEERAVAMQSLAAEARAAEAVARADVEAAEAAAATPNTGGAQAAKIASARDVLTRAESRQKAMEQKALSAKNIAEARAASPTWNPMNFDEVPEAWWCGNGEMCILDWTPCVSKKQKKCPPTIKWSSTSPRGLIGRVLRRAFDLLESDCPTATLVTPRGATWYKDNGIEGKQKAITRVSHSMAATASRIANMYMRCPVGSEVSAMLRIAQEPLFHKPPEVLENKCHKFLSQLNAIANELQPRGQQTCRHMLATDYFVMADGGLSQLHNKGMKRCFLRLGNFANSSVYFKVDKPVVEYGVYGRPDVQWAYQKDEPGLRAILELAMLARADTCIEYSHMAQSIGNMLRVELGKPKCRRLAPLASTLAPPTGAKPFSLFG